VLRHHRLRPPDPLPEKPSCFKHSTPLVALQEINARKWACLYAWITAALSRKAILNCGEIILDKSVFMQVTGAFLRFYIVSKLQLRTDSCVDAILLV
jgi:hypothetical protein